MASSTGAPQSASCDSVGNAASEAADILVAAVARPFSFRVAGDALSTALQAVSSNPGDFIFFCIGALCHVM